MALRVVGAGLGRTGTNSLKLALEELLDRLEPRWRQRESAIAACERHNDAVRSEVSGDRLVDWVVGDDWEPICTALGAPVPSTPFPHANTAAEFRAGKLEGD